MPNFLANLSARVIGIAVAVLALILIVGFTVLSCDKRRSEAAQARVEHSQAQAAATSAADAINAVEASGEASRASEELTRNNSEEIHAAPGANDRVNAGVDAAGRAALCRRAAYRDDPKCREKSK
jgi:ABC-type protease/lipase transport system fused ATPase/permease subunit